MPEMYITSTYNIYIHQRFPYGAILVWPSWDKDKSLWNGLSGQACGDTSVKQELELDLASHSPLPLPLTTPMWLTAEHTGGTSDVSAHILD